MESGLVVITGIGGLAEPTNVVVGSGRTQARVGLMHRRSDGLPRCDGRLLLAQNVSPRVVMEGPGHTPLATTMDLYAHVIPEVKREAAPLMVSILAAPA